MRELHFRFEGASAKLVKQNRTLAVLSTLYSTKLGQGHATQVVQNIVDYADDHELRLILIASPFGYSSSFPVPDVYRLTAFYQKFGFEFDNGSRPPHLMTRLPREKNKHPNERHDSQ